MCDSSTASSLMTFASSFCIHSLKDFFVIKHTHTHLITLTKRICFLHRLYILELFGFFVLETSDVVLQYSFYFACLPFWGCFFQEKRHNSLYPRVSLFTQKYDERRFFEWQDRRLITGFMPFVWEIHLREKARKQWRKCSHSMTFKLRSWWWWCLSCTPRRDDTPQIDLKKTSSKKQFSLNTQKH